MNITPYSADYPIKIVIAIEINGDVDFTGNLYFHNDAKWFSAIVDTYSFGIFAFRTRNLSSPRCKTRK